MLLQSLVNAFWENRAFDPHAAKRLVPSAQEARRSFTAGERDSEKYARHLGRQAGTLSFSSLFFLQIHPVVSILDFFTQLASDSGFFCPRGLGRGEKKPRIRTTRQDPIKLSVPLHRQLYKIMETADPSIMRLLLKLLSISDGEQPAADSRWPTLSASPSKEKRTERRDWPQRQCVASRVCVLCVVVSSCSRWPACVNCSVPGRGPVFEPCKR